MFAVLKVCTVVCIADTGFMPGDGSSPGICKRLGAINSRPRSLPLVRRKDGLLVLGICHSQPAEKKELEKLHIKMQQNC